MINSQPAFRDEKLKLVNGWDPKMRTFFRTDIYEYHKLEKYLCEQCFKHSLC